MNLIKLHRRSRGWSQEDLAKRVGTSKQLVSFWESGRCMPGQMYLPKLAKVLGLKPLDILESLSGAQLKGTAITAG